MNILLIKRLFYYICLVGFVGLFVGILPYSQINAESWNINTIDSVGTVGEHTSITTDANNNYLISYYDQTNGDLKFAKYDGSTWTTSTIDSVGNVGTNTSITTDANNNYLISYYDQTNGDLKFAKYDGSTWTTSTIDSDRYVGLFTSITTDADNNYLISYYDGNNSALKFAKYNGSTWTTSTIDSVGYMGLYPSITTDADNNYLISYYNYTNGDLKFAKYNGSTWTTSTIDSVGNVGLFTSITTDADNNYLISYHDTTNKDLKFAKYNGSTWTTSIIDSVGYVGPYSSITTDANNNYLISYSYYESGGTYELKFAKYENSTWGVGTITTIGSIGTFNSISTDINNNYLISYYDNANSDLKFATQNTALTIPPTITLTALSPDPSSDTTPTFSGTATQQGVPIISVEYQIDETQGSWVNCSAIDGTFNKDEEPFSCSVSSPLSYGEHTIYVRATNSEGITTVDGSETTDVFIIALDLTAPTISLTALSPDPNNDTTPTFTGWVSETDASISSVEYQIDGTQGNWSDCTAFDSSFDSRSETFTCTVSPPLSYGEHTIYVRATNSDGTTTASGSETTDVFTLTFIFSYYLSRYQSQPIPHFMAYAEDPGVVESVQYKLDETSEIWNDCVPLDGAFDSIEEDFYIQIPSNLSYGTHTYFIRVTNGNGVTTPIGEEFKYTFFYNSFKYPWSTSISIVDSSTEAGLYSSITTDKDNNYLVAYRDDDNSELKFAKFDGVAWTTSTIDSIGDVGEYVSITTDANNNYLIAYFDGTNRDLKFAKFDGNTWTISTIDSIGDVGYNNSITTDANNNYLIAYNSDFGIKLARYNGSNWSISVVDDNPGWGGVSITTDSNNNYLIAYANDDSELQLAKFNGSNWSYSVVDTYHTDSDGGVSITTDSNNNYLISYSSYDPSNNYNEILKFAKFNGNDWELATIDSSSSDIGRVSSIAVDDSGNYIISYAVWDYTNTLKLAKYNGNSWIIGEIDPVIGFINYNASLAIDKNGKYIISYEDYDNGILKVATITPDNNLPKISLIPVSPDPTNNRTPSISGIATKENGKIKSVEYQVDDTTNTWLSCDIGRETFLSESFESEIFPPTGWIQGEGSSWTKVDSTSSNGTYSLMTGNIGQNESTATISKSINFDEPTTLFFDWKVSSEYQEVLVFCLDNEKCTQAAGYTDRISGEQDWDTLSIDIPSGAHTLTWKFAKNDWGNNWGDEESDRGWIDNISIVTQHSSSNNFTCTVDSPLEDGIHTIFIRATDNFDNISALDSKASDTFTIDTTPPSITIKEIGLVKNLADSNPLTVYFTSNKPVIKGITEPNSTVYFVYSGNTYTSVADSNGNFTITLNVNSGNNTIQYYSKDVSNNQSVTKTLTLIVGTESFPNAILEMLGLLPENNESTPEDSAIEQNNKPKEENPDNEIQTIQFVDQDGNPMIGALVEIDGKEYVTDSKGEIAVVGLQEGKSYKVKIEHNGINYESEVLGEVETEGSVIISLTKDDISKGVDVKKILIYGVIGFFVLTFFLILLLKKRNEEEI